MGDLRPVCVAVTALWDEAINDFLEGGSAVPAALGGWSRSYAGRGAGEVTFDAIPEPYLGDLNGRPAGVFLALNPGRADLDFQSRSGLFADEIRQYGSYSAWAASWPYLRDPWVARKGRNRHHSNRLRFLQTWTERDDITGTDMVGFELFPWHSTAVTARMRPDPAVIEEHVLAPLRELAAPVFAFGAEWQSLLEERLHLPVIDRLGAGGRPYGSTVPSRAVMVFEDRGLRIVAERHSGSAGPPSASEARLLRQALADI
jgi:hypothetical protein